MGRAWESELGARVQGGSVATGFAAPVNRAEHGPAATGVERPSEHARGDLPGGEEALDGLAGCVQHARLDVGAQAAAGAKRFCTIRIA